MEEKIRNRIKFIKKGTFSMFSDNFYWKLGKNFKSWGGDNFKIQTKYTLFAQGDSNSHQYLVNVYNVQIPTNQVNKNLFSTEIFFKQLEYAREGIAWRSVGYHDNQPCLEALHAPVSVFGVLDEVGGIT